MSPTVLSSEEKSEGDVAIEQVISSSSSLRVRNRRRCPEFTPVVMAAGCGSQMFELAENTPKCMIPLGNTPMIWFSIDYLIQHKFEEIFIVVRRGAKDKIDGFLTTQIRKQNIEVLIEYICIDDDADVGTADSLRLVAPKTKSDLLVISSDLITRVSLHDIATVHRANNAALTALIAPRYSPPTPDGRKKRNKKDDRDFMGLDPRDDRILFISNEKDIESELVIKRGQLMEFPHMRLHTNLIDCHLYLVSRTALGILEAHPDVSMMKCELLPLLVRKQIKQIVNTDTVFDDRIYSIKENQDDEMKPEKYIFDILCESESVGCYVHQSDKFTLRVNQLHNYTKYNKAVVENMEDVLLPSDPESCEISKMTQIGKCSRVGSGVKVAEKCSFKRSFLGDNVVVGAHCKIVDCVIMNDVRVEDNVTLTNCIVCSDVVIRAGATLKDCRVCDGKEVKSGSEFIGETLATEEIQNMMSFSISNSECSSDNDELAK